MPPQSPNCKSKIKFTENIQCYEILNPRVLKKVGTFSFEYINYAKRH